MHWLSTSLMLACNALGYNLCLVLKVGFEILYCLLRQGLSLWLRVPGGGCYLIKKSSWLMSCMKNWVNSSDLHTQVHTQRSRYWMLVGVLAYQNVRVLPRVVFPHVPPSCIQAYKNTGFASWDLLCGVLTKSESDKRECLCYSFLVTIATPVPKHSCILGQWASWFLIPSIFGKKHPLQ